MTRPLRRSPPRAVIARLICRAAEMEKPRIPVRERVLVVSLDDQMDVVALDAHVDDAKVVALRRDDRRLAERQVDVASAQAIDAADDPDRDVHRMPAIVLGPYVVARARTLPLGLAARASALAAVRPEDHLDLIALHTSLAHGASRCSAARRDLDFADNLSSNKISYLLPEQTARMPE
jgi:hypothetical protein